jgi:hypothetical protein
MNNQLNPDPQGGESNMTEAKSVQELLERLESGKGRLWPKAEGATTQPTPAVICVDPNCATCAEGRRIDAEHEAHYGAMPLPSAGSKPQEELPEIIYRAEYMFSGQWCFFGSSPNEARARGGYGHMRSVVGDVACRLVCVKSYRTVLDQVEAEAVNEARIKS